MTFILIVVAAVLYFQNNELRGRIGRLTRQVDELKRHLDDAGERLVTTEERLMDLDERIDVTEQLLAQVKRHRLADPD